MAVRSQEAEIIRGGCSLRAPSDGQYVQNMLQEQEVWHVRKGFGQVAQLDTTMCAWPNNAGSTSVVGYKETLGSYLLKTSFGHEQLVSVFTADVSVSNLPPDSILVDAGRSSFLKGQSDTVSIYIVSIFDVTTGSRWEEPLYYHTSENSTATAEALDMQFWHGHYETNGEEDYQRWITPVAEDPFYFTELYDILYFGNKDTGLLAYFPSVFRTTRPTEAYTGDTHTSNLPRLMLLDGVAAKSWAAPYSETALIKKAVATAVSANVAYVPPGRFPKPVLVAAFSEASGGSLVYVDADRRTIFFSEAGYPTAIPEGNFLIFPGDEPITAIAEQTGNLVIWTENTMWYFQPSQSFLHVDRGMQLTQVTDSVGCLGPSVITKGAAFGALYWMNKNGCYRTTGNMSVEPISAAIDPFFKKYITSPLHNFFQANGQLTTPATSSLIFDQPRTMLKLDPENASATYWAKKRLVLFTIPNMSLSLVFHEETKEWSFWSTESVVAQAADGDPVTGVTRNIENAWLAAGQTDLYLVGGIDTADGVLENQVDLGDDGSRETTEDMTNRSYYILKYGRGGAVDRSVEAGEDQRIGIGQYRDRTLAVNVNETKDHAFVFGRPIPVPYGEVVGDSTSSSTNPIYWVPLSLVLGEKNYDGTALSYPTDKITSLRLEVNFDNDAWTPVFRTSGGTDYELAWEPFPEHAGSRGGWGYNQPLYTAGASYHGGRGVQCFDNASPPVPSRTSSRLVFSFHPAYTASGIAALAASKDWIVGPYLNAQRNKLNRLMLVPMKMTSKDTYKVGMGISAATGAGGAQAIRLGAYTGALTQLYVWDQAFLGSKRRTANTTLNAQAVDWIYKSDNLALKENVRAHVRGTSSLVLTHGKAPQANRVFPNWAHGLLNQLTSADLKGWTSQVVDVYPALIDATSDVWSPNAVSAVGGGPAVDMTIRQRFKDSSGDLDSRTFGDGAVYGTKDSAGYTNIYIIDDEEINQIAISDSVKGDSVSVMLYGYLRNKAEKIVVESSKILYRVLQAGRRRSGR